MSAISSRFFENQPNDICSHLSEKASKGTFLKPEKLQNHCNELKRKRKGEKERARRRKGGEENNSNGCTLSFYNSYFGAPAATGHNHEYTGNSKL